MKGSISRKYEPGYEPGNDGPGAISSGKRDPGGKSYGLYQLSSKKGTLQIFLKQTGYDQVIKGKIGSSEFDKSWQRIAAEDPKFAAAQHSFIETTHFNPVASEFKKSGLQRLLRLMKLYSQSVYSMGELVKLLLMPAKN